MYYNSFPLQVQLRLQMEGSCMFYKDSMPALHFSTTGGLCVIIGRNDTVSPFITEKNSALHVSLSWFYMPVCVLNNAFQYVWGFGD